MNFGNLKLEQAAEEGLVGARNGNLGVVVLIVDIGNDGAHGFALAEEVAGYGLALGQEKLVFLVVEEQRFAAPCLVHFACHKLAFKLLELIVDGFLLQVEDTALECLAQVEDSAAAELLEYDFAGMLLANLCLGVVVGTRVGQRYLQVGVLHLSIGHDFEILENLHVALVGVENHVEVLVGAEHFCQHVSERLFEHANHCGLVDVLKFFELGKLFDHIGSFLFLCHCYCGNYFLFRVVFVNQNFMS